MMEAVAQLKKGLEVLANLAEGTARQQHELNLRLALGPALIATQGWAASVTGPRARRPPHAPGSRAAAASWRGSSGDFSYQTFEALRAAHEPAAAILRIGEASNDALFVHWGTTSSDTITRVWVSSPSHALNWSKH
jgi:hypothetical protein